MFDAMEQRSDHWYVRTTVAALLANGSKPVIGSPSNDWVADHYRGFSFLGMSMDEARELRSYPKGLEMAQRFAADLPRIQMAGIGRVKCWADDGDEFDRDRSRAGFDDCWRSSRKGKGSKRPIVKITASIGGNCDVDAEDMAWSGAAAFAIVDAAESAGYRVELSAMSYADRSYPSNRLQAICIEVPLKAAGDPLDRETVAMALACPAFFRFHVLNSKAAIPAALSDVFGRSMPLPAQYRGDIHLPHAYGQDTAAHAVRDTIARIEAGIFDNAAAA